MIGIISDIHGNYVALQAVLKALDNLEASKILCLGDVGGYYCQINECCDELRSRRIFSLMGNHDWYLTQEESCPRSNSANICIAYQKSILTDTNKEWLSALKPKAVVDLLDLVHGGWNDHLDEYVTPSQEYFSRIQGKFFVSGHTHIPCIWSDGKQTYCNPGSVGQPRDGDPRASFAIFHEGEFRIHRVPYDIEEIQDKMMTAGFLPYFYENLSFGTRIGSK